MFVSPLNKYNVLSAFSYDIIDRISLASFVLNDHFFTWNFRSINTNIQNIVSSFTTVYREAVMPISLGIFYSEA